MDHEQQELLRIGLFSTLSRISVRMLRHYQEHGVLAPAYIDPHSGHRFYQPEQLERARLIVQLRDAGFSIDAITSVLSSITDPAKVEAAVEDQRRELSRRREELHGQLAALGRVSSILRGRPEMTDVRVVTLPEMTLASLRRVIPTYGDEGILWQEMMPLLERSKVSFPAGGISGASFHDPDYRENDVDVDAWIQVSEPFDPAAPLSCRIEPERRVVMATLRGDYSQMPDVTGAIGAYIAERRLRTGPMFNIYRVSPAQNPDPSTWVTDVCFPIDEQ
ncbi:MerR family transcriptional regulator [Actinomycetaceae bacterium L2_0104]